MTFSYSDECPTKKSFQYVKIMLPLFRAVVKEGTIEKSRWKDQRVKRTIQKKRIDRNLHKSIEKGKRKLVTYM